MSKPLVLTTIETRRSDLADKAFALSAK